MLMLTMKIISINGRRKVDAPSVLMVLMDGKNVDEHGEMQPIVQMEGHRQGRDQEQEQ